MSALVDTSIMIDYLRGKDAAAALLDEVRHAGRLHASDITRLEILAGMRSSEREATRAFLSVFEWHPVDSAIVEEAGALGRRWLRSHHTIGGADLAIAATAILQELPLLTLNVTRFPMFPKLHRPY